jgi:hypothetical protein
MAYLVISLFFPEKDILFNLRVGVCHPFCFQRMLFRSLRAKKNKILGLSERRKRACGTWFMAILVS